MMADPTDWRLGSACRVCEDGRVDERRTGDDPRPAATIVVARPAEGSTGVQVLVVRRSARSRFGPGYVVFPGGVMESGDAALAEAWFGNSDERARACALRELAEETGLRLHADVAGLPRIARWVAPDSLPIRFDALFFAAADPGMGEPTADGVEIEAAWWTRPDEVLGGARAGEISLAWPTLRTMEALAACSTVEEVLALRVEQEPPPEERDRP
jgi:8-oxo-dGTP pyrophosphatase MutT (NUDIX family)